MIVLFQEQSFKCQMEKNANYEFESHTYIKSLAFFLNDRFTPIR